MEGTGGTYGSQEEKGDGRKERGFSAMLWRERDMTTIMEGCRAARACGLCYGPMAKEVGGWQGLADTSHSVSAGGKTKVRIGKACISRQEISVPSICA